MSIYILLTEAHYMARLNVNRVGNRPPFHNVPLELYGSEQQCITPLQGKKNE